MIQKTIRFLPLAIPASWYIWFFTANPDSSLGAFMECLESEVGINRILHTHLPLFIAQAVLIAVIYYGSIKQWPLLSTYSIAFAMIPFLIVSFGAMAFVGCI